MPTLRIHILDSEVNLSLHDRAINKPDINFLPVGCGVKCVYLTDPFAGASANRWMCLCCLSDGAHHQLYQSALLSV